MRGRRARRRALAAGALLCGLLLAWGPSACERNRTEDAAGEAFAQEAALHVVVCGSGSGMPAVGRAGPCTAVLAAGRLLLVDVGPGSWRNVALSGLAEQALAGVLLTRLDASHVGDLGEAAVGSWHAGRAVPLPVHGPPGVGRVVSGFAEAYAPDAALRLARHGEAMPTEGGRLEARPLVALRDPEVVLDADGLRVLAFPLTDVPGDPAVGYRIEFGGRSVVVLGAARGSRALRATAAGAELLVHEAQAAHLVEARADALATAGSARDAQLLRDTLGARATPAQAVALAREIGARELVLTHLSPPLDDPTSVLAFLRGPTEGWQGRVRIGRDGMHFVLPVGAPTIRLEEVGR